MVVGQLDGPVWALQAGWCYRRVALTYLELLIDSHKNKEETRSVVELTFTFMHLADAFIQSDFQKRVDKSA